jgi:hypothetical protein
VSKEAVFKFIGSVLMIVVVMAIVNRLPVVGPLVRGN